MAVVQEIGSPVINLTLTLSKSKPHMIVVVVDVAVVWKLE